MQQRVTSGLTPLPPLQIASSFGPSAGSTTPPGPSASSIQAHPEVAQKAPRSKAGKAQLAAASQKRGCGGGSKGICLEDLSASHGAKRRKRSNQPVARNTKTRFRTPMTPTNPLMGLSQVLLCLPCPPARLVPLPRHPSDRRGVFHSAPPASVHEQTLHRVTSWIISLV